MNKFGSFYIKKLRNIALDDSNHFWTGDFDKLKTLLYVGNKVFVKLNCNLFYFAYFAYS